MEAIQSIKENDRIILELNSHRKFECNFLSANQTSIIITNSIDLATNKHRKNQQQFYKSEIREIHTLTNDTPAVKESPINNTKTTPMQLKKKKVFKQHEVHRIECLVKNVVYISHDDESYFSAINDIKYQEFIGLWTESNYGRLGLHAPLICICTSNKVYLFDFLLLDKKLFKEIKEIFQAEVPRKVTYNSPLIADYLLHKEKCELNGVIDAMVIYFMIEQSRQPISFENCFRKYFEMPIAFDCDREFNFQLRPLSTDAKRLAALRVVLLLKLYWHFLNELLTPVMDASSTFSTPYTNVATSDDLLNKNSISNSNSE